MCAKHRMLVERIEEARRGLWRVVSIHARQLGLTHFIDDRLDVLEPMRGIVPHLLAFGEEAGHVPSWADHVRDRQAVMSWFDRADAGATGAGREVGVAPA